MHRDLIQPRAPHLLGHELGNIRRNVPGRHRIDPCPERRPFHGEGLAEVDDGGLGGVVGRLVLRDVDDVAGHGGGGDEGAGVLAAEVAAGGIGGEVDGVDVGGDDLPVVLVLLGEISEGSSGRWR